MAIVSARSEVGDVMPSTVATGAVRTLANSLRSDLSAVRTRSAKARIDANPVEQSTVVALVKQAASETGLSQKTMALNAGVPESTISDALNQRRNFSAEWWWAQPDTFLLRFLELVMDARHLTPESASATRKARIAELVTLLLTEVA